MLANHKKEYLNKNCIDCPFCNRDRPDHSCTSCYSEMSQDECWKFEGFCSEKCKKHIEADLPAIRKEKLSLGIKCLCDEPTCAKCLLSNCKDDNCPTHPIEKKKSFRMKYKNR